MSLLLALTIVPAAGIQSAFADEPADRPATTGGDVPMEGPAEGTGLNAEEADGPVAATVREDGSLVAEGLIYKSEGDGATLVGFEDGASLEREVSVPERLTDGAFEYTVKGVAIAEGQTAPNVLVLELPQTVEDVDTKSLAVAMPALARVSVDGRGGDWSSANGMLFRQESITASSDGSTTRIANRELVWVPPAMVIARIPGTCKTVASGAFTDDRALETVMVFSIVESVAKAEKDDKGNITKEGAFTDEQVSKVNIVTPMETLVYPEGDRISADAFLAEDAPLNEKHIPWCDCGFEMDRFTVGIPYGSTSLAVAVPEDGKVGIPEITIGSYTDHPEWDPKGDTGEPASGLVFEYKADMTVSVTWKGDKAAVPSHLELPAYVIENGVKTAVTEVAPSAFEGAMQLESVVVPEGITAIGGSAFAGCPNLKDASISSTLQTIDCPAFREICASRSDSLQDAAVVDGSFECLGVDGGDSLDNNESGFDRYVSSTANIMSYTSGPDYTLWIRRVAGFVGGFQPPTDVAVCSDLEDYGSWYRCTVRSIRDKTPYLTFYDQGIGRDDAIQFALGSDYKAVPYGVADFYGSLGLSDGYGVSGYMVSVSPAPFKTTVNGYDLVLCSPGANIFLTPLIYHDTTYDIESEIEKSINTSGKKLNSKFQSYYTKSQVDGGGSNVNVNTSNLNAQTAKLVNGSATSLKSALDGTYALSNGNVNTSNIDAQISSSITTSGKALYKKFTEYTKTNELGDTYYTETEVNRLLGKTYTASDTVKNAIDAKADADAVNSKNTEQDNKIKALEDAVGASSSGDGTLASRVSAAESEIDALQSSFGAIAYDAASMEGVTSKAVMPTVYKAGGAPAIPEPKKDGCEFLGWTWKDDMQPAVGDAVREAFQASGAAAPTVTLKAHWREVVPEASYFFSEERPFDSGNDASQSYTIAVRLTDQQNKTLQSVSFSKNDGGLLTSAADGVQFHVGADRGMAGGTYQTVGWDDAAQNVPMAALDGGGYGVYVKIVLPAGAVDQSKVVSSYTGGSYVASLVKLNYTFA